VVPGLLAGPVFRVALP